MKKHLGLLVIIFIFSATGHAQNSNVSRLTNVSEYQVKAAFLYNFAKFVDWPKEVIADSSKPIIIGILGKDPFGLDLDQTIAGETVKGRKLVVKRFHQIADLEFCHILYISPSEKKNLAKIIEKVKNSSVLSVSEVKRFAEEGGIINLFNENNKVRFEINVQAAERAGLRISSRLLRLATIIGDDETNGKK
ncbi:MAG: YfiR family protein [bacterium]